MGLVSYELFVAKTSGGKIWLTPEGGVYQLFVNDTGEPSVKGTIVTVSMSVDSAVRVAPADSQAPIGVIYESGVPNGSPVKVVVYGKAEVLLKDGVSSNRGYWCGVSDTAGRMTQAVAPANTDERLRQIGYSLEGKTGGTNVLSLVQLMLN
jgi:hypothetical protein